MKLDMNKVSIFLISFGLGGLAACLINAIDIYHYRKYIKTTIPIESLKRYSECCKNAFDENKEYAEITEKTYIDTYNKFVDNVNKQQAVNINEMILCDEMHADLWKSITDAVKWKCASQVLDYIIELESN